MTVYDARLDRADHETTAAIVKPLASWREHAACAGRDMDPARGSYAWHAAIDLCLNGCPVLEQCRQWVMGLNKHIDPGGIVAGTGEIDRQRLRHGAAVSAAIAARSRGDT